MPDNHQYMSVVELIVAHPNLAEFIEEKERQIKTLHDVVTSIGLNPSDATPEQIKKRIEELNDTEWRMKDLEQ